MKTPTKTIDPPGPVTGPGDALGLFLGDPGQSTRYTLDRPFRLGEYVYATDSRGVARVPASAMPQVGEVKKPPPVEELPWDGPSPGPVTLPDPGPLRVAECSDCSGTGKLARAKCWRCRGRGRSECPHCGQDAVCDECDGDGSELIAFDPEEHAGRETVACSSCAGAGEVAYGEFGSGPGDAAMRVGDGSMARGWIRRLRRIGIVEVCPLGGGMYRGRAGEIEAIVMGLSLDGVNRTEASA